ncbi:MAG: hypothetical protein RIT81_16500 [Deltaproteobacteria bacterium]
MSDPRFPLFERLPELYRKEDRANVVPGTAAQATGQLEAFVGLFERLFGELRADAFAQYDDLFIETCAPWVIPYIGDLLGTSNLSGSPRTLRADVADTVRLRRRKGTIFAIEQMARNLTDWAVQAQELRDQLVWSQHLNHQRPDRGGRPPYTASGVDRFTIRRGGTLPLRDAASLSLLETPFDRFAHFADLRPRGAGAVRYNLPNLAIYLWRLVDEIVPRSAPVFVPGATATATVTPVRFEIDPLARPVVLFNRHRDVADARSEIDTMPSPMPRARLTSGHDQGRPERYVSIDVADAAERFGDVDAGLVLHVPAGVLPGFDPAAWRIRGANLCAWEAGLRPPLARREVAVDPDRGRLLIGASASEATPLRNGLRVTYTYGAPGPVGAQPDEPVEVGAPFAGVAPVLVSGGGNALEGALANLSTETTTPLVIRIDDSAIYDLDIAAVNNALPEGGQWALRAGRPLMIFAATDQRPIVRLARPIGLRPTTVIGAGVRVAQLHVRFEGLYFTRITSAATPLFNRAAVDTLEFERCTLDPEGYVERNGVDVHPTRTAMQLAKPYGFANPAEEAAFAEEPQVILRRCITGALQIDQGHKLSLTDSIVDVASDGYALRHATGAALNDHGAATMVDGVTFLGRVRPFTIGGRGGIFEGRLTVGNPQVGCLRLSYFSGDSDQLPQNYGCVRGPTAALRFVSRRFGDAAYAQLSTTCDRSILERGPRDAQMGAYGFQLEAQRWRNLGTRLRELTPVGVNPLIVPVT